VAYVVLGAKLAGPKDATAALYTGTAFAVILAALPFLGRWYAILGPAGSRIARLVRGSGLVALCGLVLVAHAVTRLGNATKTEETRRKFQGDWITTRIFFLAILTAYAVCILALTRKASNTALAIGAATGVLIGLIVYALTPFAHPRHPHSAVLTVAYWLALLLLPPLLAIAAGHLVARRTPAESEVQQACMAGLVAGGAAALVGGILTIASIWRWPHSVPLMWGNPDVNAVHGTPDEWAMTASDSASRYLPILIIAPGVVGLLAAVGASIALTSVARQAQRYEVDFS
jgi:hypothetical protein